MEILFLIAALIADAAIGLAAYKMSKSNTTTNATLLSLLTQHTQQLADHESRIGVLEKAA